MRATEFTTEEAKSAKFNGLVMKYAFNDNALLLKAFTKEGPLAYVKFVKEKKELYPQDLWVHDEYRNRGIAKSMYDFLKSEGYIINRSHDQSKAGAGFWDKHRGEDEYVWEDEKLDELFQPGKDWKWSFKGSTEAVAVFHVGDIPYQFYAHGSDGEWEVSFKNAKRGGTRGTKFGLTGTGNSAEVMSTVTDIMRAFLKEYQDRIKVLMFTAAEPSRQALYARMVRRLLPDWSIESQNIDGKTSFYLTNPNSNDLEESFDTQIPYKIDKATADDFQVIARIGDRQIIYGAGKVDDPGVWEIAFLEKGIPGGPKKSDTFGKSGSGNELQVFSFVIAATKELIARYRPLEIKFTSSKQDENRTSLYARLIKRFPIEGYTFMGVATKRNEDEFIIRRNDYLKSP